MPVRECWAPTLAAGGENLSQTTEDTFPTQEGAFLKENLSHIYTSFISPRISWKRLAQPAKQEAKNSIHCEKVLLQLTEIWGFLCRTFHFSAGIREFILPKPTALPEAARHCTLNFTLGQVRAPSCSSGRFGKDFTPAPTHSPAPDCLEQEGLDPLTIYILIMLTIEQTLTRNA